MKSIDQMVEMMIKRWMVEKSLSEYKNEISVNRLAKSSSKSLVAEIADSRDLLPMVLNNSEKRF